MEGGGLRCALHAWLKGPPQLMMLQCLRDCALTTTAQIWATLLLNSVAGCPPMHTKSNGSVEHSEPSEISWSHFTTAYAPVDIYCTLPITILAATAQLKPTISNSPNPASARHHLQCITPLSLHDMYSNNHAFFIFLGQAPQWHNIRDHRRRQIPRAPVDLR